MGRWASMRWRPQLAIVSALLLGACGTSTTAAPSARPPKVRTYPPEPAGGTDCGITNEMSGWPTTTMPGPTIYSCISDALASGHPARLVVIHPSTVYSGTKTSDGYAVPGGIFFIYRVLGTDRLEVTTDRREAGGAITTEHCSGLSPLVPASPPVPSGCKPG